MYLLPFGKYLSGMVRELGWPESAILPLGPPPPPALAWEPDECGNRTDEFGNRTCRHIRIHFSCLWWVTACALPEETITKERGSLPDGGYII